MFIWHLRALEEDFTETSVANCSLNIHLRLITTFSNTVKLDRRQKDSAFSSDFLLITIPAYFETTLTQLFRHYHYQDVSGLPLIAPSINNLEKIG